MFVHPTLSVAAEADWLGAQAAAPTKRGHNAAPEPSERQAQRAIVDWARRVLPPGSIVHHVANQAPAESDNYRANLALDGQVSGWPDLALCLPAGRGWPAVVWLEVKRPGGVVSVAQREVIERLALAGHAVGIAVGIESARHVLAQFGVPLAEASGLPMAPAGVRYAKPPKVRVLTKRKAVATPGTVPARIGGSRFALPADKVPGGVR